MGVVEYVLPDRVLAAIADKRNEVLGWLKAGLVDSRSAQRQIREFVREMVARHKVDAADAQSNIAVRCRSCCALHIIPRETRFYHCTCSPSIDRPTFRGREFLT